MLQSILIIDKKTIKMKRQSLLLMLLMVVLNSWAQWRPGDVCTYTTAYSVNIVSSPRNNRGIAVSNDGEYLYLGYNSPINFGRIELSSGAQLGGSTTDRAKCIAVDEIGRVYQTGIDGEAIKIYNSDLSTVLYTIPMTKTEGIAVKRIAGDLFLYATERAGTLSRFKLTESGGAITNHVLNGLDGDGIITITGGNNIRGVGVGDDDKILIANPGANKIYKLNADGSGQIDYNYTTNDAPYYFAFIGSQVFVTNGIGSNLSRVSVINYSDMTLVGNIEPPFATLGYKTGTADASDMITGIAAFPDGKGFYLTYESGTTTDDLKKEPVIKVSFPVVAVAGVASANQVICNANNPSDVTLTGFTGNIKWQISTDNIDFFNMSSATSATLSSLLMGSLTTTTYYRALVTNGSSTATSNVVTVAVLPKTNTWNGATSDDWNTPENWSIGSIPLHCNDVIIPKTGIDNFPKISTTDAICHDLTINPGAQLTLTDGSALSAEGNLLIESSKEIGTGTIVDKNISGGITTIGTTTIQQFLTGSSVLAKFPEWYVSSPVVGATSNTFDAAASGNNLSFWTESTHLFTEIDNNSTQLEKGKGYIAHLGVNENVVSFAGSTLNSGNITLNDLTYTVDSHNNRGYNLIGNPYVSFLNWGSLWNLQSALLQPTLFTRYANGSLKYYNAVNGLTSNTNLNKDIKDELTPGIIAPLQAFWVEVIRETSPGNEGSIYFDNANRSHQAQPANRLKAPAEIQNTQQLIRLQITDGTGIDEALILFNENAQDTYEFWDSHKMFTGMVPEIYTMAGNEKLAINGLKNLGTLKEIPLGFHSVSANNFTLSLSEFNNFPTGYTVSIVDNTALPVTLTDLTTNTYNFSSGVADDNNRFTIIIKDPGMLTQVSNSELDNVFYAIDTNSQINVICNDIVNSDAKVIVYNSLGIQILSNLLSGKVTVIEKELLSGIYIVKVINGSKTISKKVIIK